MEIKCPFCENKEKFIETIMEYAVVRTGMHIETPKATICENCGTVIRVYIENPQKLKTKKER